METDLVLVGTVCPNDSVEGDLVQVPGLQLLLELASPLWRERMALERWLSDYGATVDHQVSCHRERREETQVL